MIEYQSTLGRNTAVERPAAEAVRVFWRFLDEKWGIKATVKRA